MKQNTKQAQQKVDEKVEELKDAVMQAETAKKPSQPKKVVLGHPNPEAIIYYTTDGTYPIPNQSLRYTGPFYIHEDTLVKCVALVGNDVSTVFTKQYLV